MKKILRKKREKNFRHKKRENPKAIEGGIMVYRVADFSPAKDVLEKRDVLLQIDEFHIGENGTVEFRKGERTKWIYAIAKKRIGESITLKFFRGGYLYTKTIKLDTTRNDIFHVGEKQYDVKPSYLIKAGLVFQPLSLNLYAAINIGSTVQAKILEYRSQEHPRYVLMTKVLQTDITTGYEMTNQIVESVNGIDVHTMDDLIKAFKGDINEYTKENVKENEHCIELYGDAIITIITSDLEEETKRVAKKYDIKETMFIDQSIN